MECEARAFKQLDFLSDKIFDALGLTQSRKNYVTVVIIHKLFFRKMWPKSFEPYFKMVFQNDDKNDWTDINNVAHTSYSKEAKWIFSFIF